MPSPLITLITDFSTRDYFVGCMKGVILNINPNVRFVDVSHEIQPQNIREAAFLLKSVYRYFPKGTIHMVIVDPGVGSTRKPLIAASKNEIFIAPDNGVLSWIYEEEKDIQVYEITSSQYFIKKEGTTFHGRDIFSPVAAWVTKGILPDQMGKNIEDYIKFPIPIIKVLDDKNIQGQVIYIDRFGNIITTIKRKDLHPWLTQGLKPTITIKGRVIHGLKGYYAQASPSEISALINSDDYLEIFLSQASAKSLLDVTIDDPVIVR